MLERQDLRLLTERMKDVLAHIVAWMLVGMLERAVVLDVLAEEVRKRQPVERAADHGADRERAGPSSFEVPE